jgi:hypothetical protein
MVFVRSGRGGRWLEGGGGVNVQTLSSTPPPLALLEAALSLTQSVVLPYTGTIDECFENASKGPSAAKSYRVNKPQTLNPNIVLKLAVLKSDTI